MLADQPRRTRSIYTLASKMYGIAHSTLTLSAPTVHRVDGKFGWPDQGRELKTNSMSLNKFEACRSDQSSHNSSIGQGFNFGFD